MCIAADVTAIYMGINTAFHTFVFHVSVKSSGGEGGNVRFKSLEILKTQKKFRVQGKKSGTSKPKKVPR